jgi:hypothetical protein
LYRQQQELLETKSTSMSDIPFSFQQNINDSDPHNQQGYNNSPSSQPVPMYILQAAPNQQMPIFLVQTPQGGEIVGNPVFLQQVQCQSICPHYPIDNNNNNINTLTPEIQQMNIQQSQVISI